MQVFLPRRDPSGTARTDGRNGQGWCQGALSVGGSPMPVPMGRVWAMFAKVPHEFGRQTEEQTWAALGGQVFQAPIYIYVMIASSASSLSLVCRKGPAYKPPLEIDHPSPLFNTEVED